MTFLRFLEGIRTPALTAFFQFVTMFGEEMVIISLFCALYWCFDKKLAYGVGISFFLSAILVQGMKVAFRVPRPWILDPKFTPVTGALEGATGFSFPSGHTQTAASVFGYLGLSSKKKGPAIAAWTLVLLVALSRLYLGVHTPQDVLVSLAISLIVSLATLRLVRVKRSDSILLVVMTVLSLAMAAYALVLRGQSHIDEKYLSDCFKAAGGCLGCGAGFALAHKYIPFQTETPKPWQQVVKLLAGIAGMLVIQLGGKALLGGGFLVSALRYFSIAFWALALYPLIFTRLLRQG